MSIVVATVLCLVLSTLAVGLPNSIGDNSLSQPVNSQKSDEKGHPTFQATNGTKEYSRVYEFGAKTKYDIKLATINYSMNYRFPMPTYRPNYRFDVSYPPYQEGSVSMHYEKVTYARIEVLQTSEKGYAHITNGAIGTNIVQFRIIATDTDYAYYFAELYTSSIVEKTYTFGKQSPKSILVKRLNNTKEFQEDSNSSFIIKYSGSPENQNITSVIIKVNQTSDLGNADITSGALGTNQMEIKINAEKIKMLSYEADFYTSSSSLSSNLSFSVLLIFSLRLLMLIPMW